MFDLTKNDINTIAIFKAYSGLNCYIAETKDKSNIFEGFILRNGPQAQTLCNVSFHPSSISGKFIPRLEFRIVHTLTGEVKEAKGKDVRISFGQAQEGCQEFWKMIGFLSGFKDLVDTGDFKKTYQIVDSSAYIVEFKSKNQAEQVKELSKIIQESGLTDETIRKALSDKRDESLLVFNGFLTDTTSIDKYKEKYSIKEVGEECAWHHFLKSNPWILGLSVDIRFIREFYPEAEVGISSTVGRGSPEADLLGIRDYTVLVELKTSETEIFTEKRKVTSRANTWSFSEKFIDGVSQCLGQKFDWDKTHESKDLVNPETKEIISQDEIRTIDPKTIFVIGNKNKEMPQNLKTQENFWKRDTFERFRRNNRNIEIITFDELYERAYFIVHGVNL